MRAQSLKFLGDAIGLIQVLSAKDLKAYLTLSIHWHIIFWGMMLNTGMQQTFMSSRKILLTWFRNHE